jgi:hypothetical protein
MPPMRLPSSLLVIAVLAALVPKSVEASPLIFTDRATFLNVHAALGLPPLAYETFDTNGWSFVIPGLNDPCIRDLNGLTIHADCHQVGAFQAGPGIFDQHDFTTSAVFDEPQTSLGFDYTVSPPCSLPLPLPCTATGVVEFGLSNASFFLSGSGFLGIIDLSQPILRMGTSHLPPEIADGVLAMDNLLLTRVPEPSTMLLFGSAFALLQVVRLRRKNRSVFRSLN